MIEVKNLSKKYGTNLAVNDVSFTIKEGEVVGFLGPNGAGKSTIMNILTGYLSSTAGSVSVAGFNVLDYPEEVKKHIGYLPELPPLYPDMTVNEYLEFCFDLKKATFQKAPHIDEICRLVKIDHVRDRLIKNLSKGYKQRVGIAQALIGNPDVLILDEPTVGLDPKQIIEIRSLIERLSRQHTIIMSSHILSEIQAVCKRIIIINAGEIVADDLAENLAKKMSSDHTVTVRVQGPEDAAKKALATIPGLLSMQSLGVVESGAVDFVLEPKEGADIRKDVFLRLADRKLPIIELTSKALTLEQIFLRLTEGIMVKPESEAKDENEDGEKTNEEKPKTKKVSASTRKKAIDAVYGKEEE